MDSLDSMVIEEPQAPLDQKELEVELDGAVLDPMGLLEMMEPREDGVLGDIQAGPDLMGLQEVLDEMDVVVLREKMDVLDTLADL